MANAPVDPKEAHDAAIADVKRLMRLARTGALATLEVTGGAPLTTLLGVVIGLIAGALARLVVPGKQDMSIGMTILIGVIVAFTALGSLIHVKDLMHNMPTVSAPSQSV